MSTINNNTNGFTLLELLIVVAIVAILASFAVPSFQTSLANNRQTAELYGVLRDINISRSEAVKRGKRVVLCAGNEVDGCIASADWSVGWIVFVDDDANDTKAASEELIRVGSLQYSDFSLKGSSGIAQTIKFQPNGVAIATGTLSLCDRRGASHASAIILSASGKPKVSETGAGGVSLTCS